MIRIWRRDIVKKTVQPKPDLPPPPPPQPDWTLQDAVGYIIHLLMLALAVGFVIQNLPDRRPQTIEEIPIIGHHFRTSAQERRDIERKSADADADALRKQDEEGYAALEAAKIARAIRRAKVEAAVLAEWEAAEKAVEDDKKIGDEGQLAKTDMREEVTSGEEDRFFIGRHEDTERDPWYTATAGRYEDPERDTWYTATAGRDEWAKGESEVNELD